MAAGDFIRFSGPVNSKLADSPRLIPVHASGHAAGNTVVVFASHTSAGAISGVTDDKGNTYTECALDNTDTPRAGIWFSVLDTALVSGDDIIVSYSVTQNRGQVALAAEFEGAATFDSPGVIAQGTSASPSSGNKTPASAPAVAVGWVAVTGEMTDLNESGSWTMIAEDNSGTAGAASTNIVALAMRQALASTTPVAATATVTSAAWVAAIAVFTFEPADQTLTGTLFTNAPSFLAGTVTPGGVTLAGAVFSAPPSFLTGTISGIAPGQTITGVLFSAPPTFGVGSIIATGVLSIVGTSFYKDGVIVNQGAPAEGLMMNARMVQATVDFSGETEVSNWDADANTAALIAQLPTYASHGINAITVNFQGGNFNIGAWGESYDAGAWNSDGTLRAAHGTRMHELIAKMLANGITPIVGLSYFRQDQILTDETAVLNMVEVAKTFLAQWKPYIIIEVSNECTNALIDHAILSETRVVEIVDDLVSEGWIAAASWSGGYEPTLVEQGDGQVMLLHQNGLDIATFETYIADVAALHSKPIIVNEDGETTRLSFEARARAIATVEAGAGWGLHDPDGLQYYDGTNMVTMDWDIDTPEFDASLRTIGYLTGTPDPGEQVGVPVASDVSNDGWTDPDSVVVAPDLWQLVDEGVQAPDDDTTRIRSPLGPTADVIEFTITNLLDPGVTWGHYLRSRFRHANITGTPVSDVTAALIDGSTVIASHTVRYPGTTTAWSTIELLVTEAEAANITDYSDLRIRITANQVSGTSQRMQLTATELEIPALDQALEGALFTSSPVFLVGTVSGADPDQTLTGVLFSVPPTFIAGTVTSNYTLSGALFSKAPSFISGDILADQTITGIVFSAPPVFISGTVTPSYQIVGNLFARPPTWISGVVTSAYELTGAVFSAAPVFISGTITTGNVIVSGVLFSAPPTFIQGSVQVGGVVVDGVLFSKSPSFIAGSITTTYTVSGVVFSAPPAFVAGVITSGGSLIQGMVFSAPPLFIAGTITTDNVTLSGQVFSRPPAFISGSIETDYQLTGVTFSVAPVFISGTITAGGVTLQGTTFNAPPTFISGVVSTGEALLLGVVFSKPPIFLSGSLALEVEGVLFSKPPTFLAGSITADITLAGVVFSIGPSFFSGSIFATGSVLGTVFSVPPTFISGVIGEPIGTIGGLRDPDPGITRSPTARTRTPITITRNPTTL